MGYSGIIEDVRACAALRTPSRVPCLPLGCDFDVRQTPFTHKEYRTDPEKMIFLAASYSPSCLSVAASPQGWRMRKCGKNGWKSSGSLSATSSSTQVSTTHAISRAPRRAAPSSHHWSAPARHVGNVVPSPAPPRGREPLSASPRPHETRFPKSAPNADVDRLSSLPGDGSGTGRRSVRAQ